MVLPEYWGGTIFFVPYSGRSEPLILVSLAKYSLLRRTSKITKSGLPSISLSSSFVILGISSDKANVANNPIAKKMSIKTANNFFFIMTPPFNELIPLRIFHYILTLFIKKCRFCQSSNSVSLRCQIHPIRLNHYGLKSVLLRENILIRITGRSHWVHY